MGACRVRSAPNANTHTTWPLAVRVWTAPADISGAGVIALAGQAVRVDLTTIPTYLSYETGDPSRYRYLGRVGYTDGVAYWPGDVLVWPSQIVNAPDQSAATIWYRLVTGVEGTIAQGVEVTDSLPIAARVSQTAAQTLTTGVQVLLTFDAEEFDPWGMHSNGSNPTRLTVTAPGWYTVGAQVVFTAHATGQRRLVLQVNGATPIAGQAVMAVTDSSAHRLAVETQYWLNAGDYVEALATQSSGGNLDTVIASGLATAMWLSRVS